MAKINTNISGIHRQLDDITCCPICADVFNDPVILPCVHTFCLNCIKGSGVSTSKGPGAEMPCPICRQCFKIPAEGFDGLPNNFFMETLSEMVNILRAKSSKIQCDVCSSENQEVLQVAENYCQECELNLCLECCRHHRKSKLTKSHQLIQVSRYGSSRKRPACSLLSNSCSIHNTNLLDTYCTKCKVVVCPDCFWNGHKTHHGAHISAYVNEFRKEINGYSDMATDFISQLNKKKVEIQEIKSDILRWIKDKERQVEEGKEELKMIVGRHAEMLLQNLDSLKQVKLKEIQLDTDDIDAQLSCLESFKLSSKKLIDTGSASDICQAAGDLSSTADEMRQLSQLLVGQEVQTLRGIFKRTDLEDILKQRGRNLIGEIVVENDIHRRKKIAAIADDKYKPQAEFVHIIKRKVDVAISGLTILDRELFVVSSISSDVEVYNSESFSFSRQWKVMKMKRPCDLVSCKKRKCLYIMDAYFAEDSKKILRLDPKGQLIKKWSTGGDEGRLSVTDECNVILSVRENNKISEYSPYGQLLREIKLPDNLVNPGHTIKVSKDLYIVSHKIPQVVGETGHGICQVNTSGERGMFFSTKTQLIGDRRNIPFHLIVDAEGIVTAADINNCRVLLLNSNLEFIREILSKDNHGLRHPGRIYLDESSGRLFVADCEYDQVNNIFRGGRILIFYVK